MFLFTLQFNVQSNNDETNEKMISSTPNQFKKLIIYGIKWIFVFGLGLK